MSLLLEKAEVLAPCDKSHLDSICYVNPLFPAEKLKLVHSDIDVNIGSGLVHIAGAHSLSDFKVSLKYNLAIKNLIDKSGRYNADAGFSLSGIDVLKDGTNAVLELLKNHLLHCDVMFRAYPHDWRTLKPVLTLPSLQWFIDTEKIKEIARSAISDLAYKNALVPHIESRPYWCISRQRCWGLPIPVGYQKNSGRPILTHALLSKWITELKRERCLKFWWRKDHDSIEFERGTDVFDVWFDSGSSFRSVLKDEVADLYCEGVDQLNGWFLSSLLLSAALNKKRPFKRMLTHGFVVDECGAKMSKSAGNVVTPSELFESSKKSDYGKDAFRRIVALEYKKPNILLGNSSMKRSAARIAGVRSILRYLVANLHDWDHSKFLEYAQNHIIDKIILDMTYRILESIDNEVEEFNYNRALLRIEDFIYGRVSNKFCLWMKDRLYYDSKNSEKRHSAQTICYILLRHFLIRLAPFMPNMCQEMFSSLTLLLNTESHHPTSNIFISWKKNSPTVLWKRDDLELVYKEIFKLISTFDRQSHSSNQCDCFIYAPQNVLDYILKLFNDEKDLETLFQCASIYLLLPEKSTPDNDDNTVQNVVIACKKTNLPKCVRCRRYAHIYDDRLCERCRNVISQFERENKGIF